MTRPHIIADIGGTNTRIALASGGIPGRALVHPSADIENLGATLQSWLESEVGVKPGDVTRISIAGAGPVTGPRGSEEISWSHGFFPIREVDLGLAFPAARIRLVNDFAAQALALPFLGAGEVTAVTRRGMAVEGGPRAIIGSGTGMGVAALLMGGHGRFVPLVGEGGHGDLAAVTDDELALHRILSERYGHVSPDRVLSGPGIEAIYLSLLALKDETFEVLTAQQIVAAATAGDATARLTLTIFSAWLGAFAGDIALTYGATGGFYISGGVVPALGPQFDVEAFRTRFEAKGRLSFYVEAIPTWLVTRENPALLGLARQG